MGFFFQYGDELKFTNKVLGTLLVISFIINVFMIVRASRQPITYIDVGKIIGETNAGYVPDNVVEIFSKYFIYLMGNISTGTIKDMYQQAVYLMSPPLQASTVKMLENEINEFKQARGSSIQTITHSTKITKTGKKTYLADVVAFREYYSYNRLTMKKAIKYRLYITIGQRNDKNPFGIWVRDYEGPVDLGDVDEYLKKEEKDKE